MTSAAMIRTARERLDWPQRRLAEALGMSGNQLSRYERGEREHPWPGELQHALDRLLWLHGHGPVGV